MPIEQKALQIAAKENHINITDMVRIRWRAKALARKAVVEQKRAFKEWGIMADWENAWTTMDEGFEIKQLGVFKEMVKRGLIFRRYKPVYWSPSSKTALAEAELEYVETHYSTAAYVKFPLERIPIGLQKRIPAGSQLSAVIWTTTPWTLPANRAIAVHSNLEYVVVKHQGDLLIFARTLLNDALKAINKNLEGPQPEIVVDSILGKDIQGAQYLNPLRGEDAPLQPVVHADFVSSESGSGLVHLAPGHGMDDYELCTSLNIPADSPVDNDGNFTAAAYPDHAELLEGKPVLSAGRDEVLKLLGDRILATHKYKHKYPYDWRTKLPVILRATEQWFADVGQEKELALKYLDDVKFLPETGRSRLESFIKGRSEWCISRQRAWGVPIPALFDEEGNAVLTEESVSHIIKVIEERGIDAWWTDSPDNPVWFSSGLTGKYTRGKDTMDVWFDSGSSWTQTSGPADLYLEGTDQHRGWFQSSLLTHTAASPIPSAPFKTLITHGFTLDKHGKKMSKSIGNTIAPSEIIDGSLLKKPLSRGPDTLRLWVASSDYTTDLVIGEQVLLGNDRMLSKWRMILKMLLGSMKHETDPRDARYTFTPSALDQIALYQMEKTIQLVKECYNRYEFYKGVMAINKWVANDVSALYLEGAKDGLYCGNGSGVMEELFVGMLRMLSPITPHLVEEAWEHRPKWMDSVEHGGPILHPFYSPLEVEFFQNGFANAWAEKRTSIGNVLPVLLAANLAVKAALEEARKDTKIGSSLEARVVLSIPEGITIWPAMDHGMSAPTHSSFLASLFGVSETVKFLRPMSAEGALKGPELETHEWLQEPEWVYKREFAIPSKESKEGEDISQRRGTAFVIPARGGKCDRCWKRDVKKEDEDKGLCDRCSHAVQNGWGWEWIEGAWVKTGEGLVEELGWENGLSKTFSMDR